MTSIIIDFFNKDITKKIITLILIGLFLFFTKKLINLYLLTFLISYLIYSLQSFITKKADDLLTIKINNKVVTAVIFAALMVSLFFVIYKYIPVLINQSIGIANEISKFKHTPGKSTIVQYAMQLFSQADTKRQGTDYAIKLASGIKNWCFNIFEALILSMFFLLEHDKIRKFMTKFEDSRISGLYKHAKDFFKNFLHTFGKVIQAQVLISLTNSILSVIFLSILGFPQLIGLGVMIFLFGLIPVAGVIISMVPLSIIAFNIGGYIKVVYILIMIVVLHAIESYILNPKLMSTQIKLPVFFIFLILIISKTIMGFWGLLLGIPIFVFLLNFLNIKLSKES